MLGNPASPNTRQCRQCGRSAAFVLAAVLACSAQPARAETEGAVGAPPPPRETAGGFQERTVLSPRGALTVEPSLSYSQNTSTTVSIDGFTILPAIAVGLISLRQTQRDTVTGALAFRYGVTPRLEVETRIPYLWREERVKERELLAGADFAAIADSSGHGLGDIEGALRYQISRGRGDGPIFIGNLRVKSRTGLDPFEVERIPVIYEDEEVGEEEFRTYIFAEQPTGSGFWSVQPSINWVYPSEPAVLYGSVGYLHNISRTVDINLGDGETDRRNIDPGDAVSVGFGMGIALNDRTSVSLGYDHTTVFRTRVTGGQPGLDDEFSRIHVGSLMLGASHRIGPRTSVGLSVAVGVTDEAPDVQATLRVPIRF